MWLCGCGGTSARLDEQDVGTGTEADDGEEREDFEVGAVVVWDLVIPGWRCSCVGWWW